MPVIDRYRALDVAKLFRADAAFAISERYELLGADGYRYAICLPANEVPHREIVHLTRRTVGRPPAKAIVLYHRFEYQGATWNEQRTVVAKIKWHRHLGQLERHVACVTNRFCPSLDQLDQQRGQRPVLYGCRQRESPQEVPEVVRQHEQLQSYLVVVKVVAR